MKHLKPYKKFKKKKTIIKRVSDAPYNWTPTYNLGSPAPGTAVPISQIKIE